MRLKTAPRGGGQGSWRVDPDQIEGFLGSCVARGRGSPKLCLNSTAPPCAPHRRVSPRHRKPNPNPAAADAWPGWILIEAVGEPRHPPPCLALPACALSSIDDRVLPPVRCSDI